jgi:hypothetical protein
MAAKYGCRNEAEVPGFQYSRTCTDSGHKFVPQRLTVLLSYRFVASVPLLSAFLELKMGNVRKQVTAEVSDSWNRIELRGDVMPSAYASWIGQAVILQVAAGDLRVPLRGTIVGESEGAIRFRIGDTWDIDIYKPMILAVEQDNWASIVMN